MLRSRDSQPDHQPRVHALLGPTNTGKTHRAIERMLDFESGMMGLPLRLLAREVYDRVSARVGERAVALVTGEEKRVPSQPRYWICTVEAMPTGLGTEFLAIDEIQLISHPERGHVFTDRLLHWRGRAETWFLGAGTVESLLREQLPGLQVDRLPRLSRLRNTGQTSVRTLPRRSAVVAFSMQQVYELADLLRVRRGGAAVVLGALSPRVRNAQVAMYQAGEVDFLVATDAIGMGLNLDIEHVALASHTKFDGREVRGLETPELAQIVGRAGRYLRDGTFGTLSPLPELPPRVVQQLEAHQFPAQRSAYYRNSQLDFDGLPALVRTLEARPPHPSLRAAPEGDDLSILRALGARSDVRELCNQPASIELLWDLCRIPNYEKRMAEHQADRLLPLFGQLLEHGKLSPSYLDEQLRKLERFDGDLDVLLARLSGVRTWLYVSHQRSWVDDASTWQERARALEDRLGDLLHERLLARFVSRRGRAARSGGRHGDASLRDVHHPFAQLAQLRAADDPEQAGIGPVGSARWAEALIAAPFDAFETRAFGDIHFAGVRIARLSRGKTPLTPTSKPLLPDDLEPGSRARVERRLQAHLKDLVQHLLEPLYPPDRAGLLREPASAPLRGLLYQLEQGLGSVARRDVTALLQALIPRDRSALARWGVELGSATVYVRDLLASDRLPLRAALCDVWQPESQGPERPNDGLYLLGPGSARVHCLRRGFVPIARWGVRCDVLERLLRALEKLPREPATARSAQIQLLLGCSERDAAELSRALGSLRRRKRRKPSRRRAASSPPTAAATATAQGEKT